MKPGAPYEVEYTNAFGRWWAGLLPDEQKKVDAVIRMLEVLGPNLQFPYSSSMKGSSYRHMRELRIQHRGRPYRILYAFDPRRTAVLLLGGDKTGDDRWYERFVPEADRLYEAHLREIERAGPRRTSGKD